MARLCDVFVVGALHLDVVVNAPRMPAMDETLVGQSVAYRFGGKGGNQAVAAARMGARVAMAGRVGDDAFAHTLLATLDREAVDRTQVVKTAAKTGMSVAIVDPVGEYGAVIVSGANLDLAPDDIDIPKDTKVLLLQNEVSEVVNTGALSTAPDPCLCILNAAPAREVAIHPRVDILIANRLEAECLTGMSPTATPVPDVAGALAKNARRAAIVTLGRDGCVVAQSDGTVDTFAGHAITPVSAHGAGDAFAGALAARVSAGAELSEAVAFANAAAALTVATPPDERGRITPGNVLEFKKNQTSNR